MKRLLLLSIGIMMAGMQSLEAQEVVELYPGMIPGAKSIPVTYREIETVKDGKVTGLSKVFHPTITLYKPDAGKANGTAVIICPGGGYQHLAMGHEGDEVARRFTAIGVTALVLKYRLPNDTTMTEKAYGPLQDAEQAIYLVRKNAGIWNINPARVGIMGFSAGGHVASSLAVHYDDQKIENQEKLSLRPDFAILIYPVVSFLSSPHVGSVNSLLGPNGTQEQKAYFSNEKHVNAETPITFLVHANNDNAVPVENSILFNQALVRNKVPSEMHLYQGGGHGFGLHNSTTSDYWFDRLQSWLTANRLLDADH